MRTSNPGKYADPDCDLCEGTGVVWVAEDDTQDCVCVATRRAQDDADSREE